MHLRTVFRLSSSAGLGRGPGEERAEGGETVHTRPCFCRTLPGVSVRWPPSHSPPSPPASRSGRRTNPYILPSFLSLSLFISSGRHRGRETENNYRQVRKESQTCSPPRPQPLARLRSSLGVCPDSQKASLLCGTSDGFARGEGGSTQGDRWFTGDNKHMICPQF